MMSQSRKVHSTLELFFKSIGQIDQFQRDAKIISSAPMHQSYLCQNCQTVLDGFRPAAFLDVDDPRTSLILESDRLIEDSALEDCHLCLLLVSKLSARDLEIMREHHARRQTGSEHAFKSRYIRNRGINSDTGSLWLMLWFQHDVEEVEDCGIEVRLSLLPEGYLMNRGQIPEVFEISTGSQVSLDSARRWLADCTLNHSQCGNSVPTSLPTRLIDTAPLSEVAQPRLCHGVDLPQGSKYATLSHCWAGIMPKRLLQVNLSAMLYGIPFEELPKTFQDAIRVVRHLGIRYIWIDSLCIIQDSDDDWQKESALMARVYAHGTCNIAAADAAGSTKGLFRNRNPQVLRPLKVQIGGVHHRGSHFVGDDSWWDNDVNSSLLSRRGWVCQERIFSPRILHFGSQQVYWECKSQRSCESFPGIMPQELCAYSPKTLEPLGSKQQAIEFWENVVCDYTGSLLTYETDKLVAISSLAAMMQKILDSDYLAGLWARDIIHQLLWRVDEGPRQFRHTRYTTYIAPSWSWASLNGYIRFNTHYGFDEGPEFNINLVSNIVISVTPVSDKFPFGQVKSGYLTLQGRLIDVTSLARDLEFQQQQSVRVAIYSRGHDEWGLDYGFHPDEIVPDREYNELTEEEEREAVATTDKYYLLPLRRIDTYRSAGLDDDSQFHGLVLENAVSSDGSRAFSRWGQFRIDGFEGDKKIRDGWRDFDEDYREDCGLERVYDEELSAFKYAITII